MDQFSCSLIIFSPFFVNFCTFFQTLQEKSAKNYYPFYPFSYPVFLAKISFLGEKYLIMMVEGPARCVGIGTYLALRLKIKKFRATLSVTHILTNFCIFQYFPRFFLKILEFFAFRCDLLGPEVPVFFESAAENFRFRYSSNSYLSS